ncbi:MAG: hypothetical protein ABIQ89_00675 [Candidatus Saccharimonadales bacterium]
MNKLTQMKKPLIVLLVAVITIGAFLAGFYVRPSYDKRQFSGSTKAAQDFVKDLTSGNNDAAYAMTSKVLQEQQDKAAFTSAVGELKSEKPELQKPQAVKNGDMVLYYQRVLNLPKSAKGSTSGLFYITLVKEDGKWKVSSLNVQ